jgi:hypothetical protein
VAQVASSIAAFASIWGGDEEVEDDAEKLTSGATLTI